MTSKYFTSPFHALFKNKIFANVMASIVDYMPADFSNNVTISEERDCIEYIKGEEGSVKRVDEYLTIIYSSTNPYEVIGVRMNGIQRMSYQYSQAIK